MRDVTSRIRKLLPIVPNPINFGRVDHDKQKQKIMIYSL